MAGTSLLALIDDIASVLDDVALLTKVAAKKTAGVLGDDLALNAQQVTGVQPDRELPVVWAVAKGSVRNKLILVPLALGISALAPWAVTPLLMIGGAFLCFEGFEKLAHRFIAHPEDDEAHKTQRLDAASASVEDLIAFEKDKINGAVRTDFILSAEIIAIALGTVTEAVFLTKVVVLVSIAAAMTVGVYGVVAAIVKLDDLALLLSRQAGSGALARAQRRAGALILIAAPWLMKSLSVAGTAAMFLVGGGIVVHGIPPLHHAIEHVEHTLSESAPLGNVVGPIAGALLNGVAGVAVGAVVLGGVLLVRRLFAKRPAAQ